MQGGVIGGICLLAFLLSKGRAEESESSRESKDLQDIDKVKETIGLRKSGDLEAPSDLKSDLAVSNAEVQSSGDGYALAYSDSSGGLTQSRATAVAGGAPASPFNPFNEELGPYIPPGSSFSQAEAQAINSDSYGQGLSSYPYPASYPYSSGLSSGQAHADSGIYQQGYNGLPNLSPYYQGSSFPQMTGQGDSESNQPIIEPNSMLAEPVPRPNPALDSLSAFSSSYPYSSRSSSSSVHAQDNSRSYQPIPIPDPNYSPYESFLVPYKGPSSTQTQSNTESYQPVPIIKPKEDLYDSNASPYSQGQNSAYGFASSHLFSKNEPYQAIPLPNPSSYDSFLVPYRDPSPPQAKSHNNEPYQPIPIPKLTPKQQEAISKFYSERAYSVADFSSSHSNGFIHNSAQPQWPADRGSYQAIPIPNNSLRIGPAQDEVEPDQSIPVPESDTSRSDSSMINQYRDQNLEKNEFQDESNAYEYQPVPNTYSPKSDASLSLASIKNVARSREYDPVIDNIDLSADIISKSGWDPYEYNPYEPSGPYPSGAEAAQAYPDFKPAAGDVVNPYSPGINPYASSYPSKLSLRPGDNPEEKEAQRPITLGGQSSPIAFEDAKSRVISPHEYVFPTKIPGGEHTIQCTKENEFHHFWSPELDCMVCICLNEYGLLQPVCASCGGCHNPPPKLPEPVPRLPEPIPVQPATPGPFEPIPIMPEPYPPVPNPEQPTKEPDQPAPTPEPYPVYPEPVPPPSPVPVTFPEPVATLPPPPAQAHCNPLPTGVPFTNPLHPCQICICRESVVTGKTDVQIECKESPQCIAPADVTALPPVPDMPVPIPLPICEKFPENVLFPHPTETCKLCKCARNLSEEGVYEQQITCYPHPDCIPKLEAITELIPPLPLPVEPYQEKPNPEPEPAPKEPLRDPYQPMEPVPLPEVVTVEPLPWPPITTIAPVPALPVTPRPGPLPGPSPHESCRPYPPNLPFQHPWDECQVCLCSEAIAVGMITVEVNCYTKPSCCIDPPDSVKAALPGNLQ